MGILADNEEGQQRDANVSDVLRKRAALQLDEDACHQLSRELLVFSHVASQ
jgi:hypothetical protein